MKKPDSESSDKQPFCDQNNKFHNSDSQVSSSSGFDDEIKKTVYDPTYDENIEKKPQKWSDDGETNYTKDGRFQPNIAESIKLRDRSNTQTYEERSSSPQHEMVFSLKEKNRSFRRSQLQPYSKVSNNSDTSHKIGEWLNFSVFQSNTVKYRGP